LNYYIVDVFSDRPFMGNPVAVVICTKELSDYEMQQIATWFNLSETTFVSDIDESKCRYKVRIFSPGGEMVSAQQTPSFFIPPPMLCCAELFQGGAYGAEQAIRQRCKTQLLG
jgi:hypothetical protein